MNYWKNILKVTGSSPNPSISVLTKSSQHEYGIFKLLQLYFFILRRSLDSGQHWKRRGFNLVAPSGRLCNLPSLLLFSLLIHGWLNIICLDGLRICICIWQQSKAMAAPPKTKKIYSKVNIDILTLYWWAAYKGQHSEFAVFKQHRPCTQDLPASMWS